MLFTRREKLHETLSDIAFMLSSVLESVREVIDKDVPPNLQSRLRPEIKRDKHGKLSIIWVSRDANMSGRPYFSRMWPDDGINYSLFTLRNVAESCEATLVCRLERNFAMIRDCSKLLNDLRKTAQEFDQRTRKLALSIRDLHDHYKDNLSDVDIEKLLTALAGDQFSPVDRSDI